MAKQNVDLSQTMLLLTKRDFLLQRMRFRDQPYSKKITHDVIHKQRNSDKGSIVYCTVIRSSLSIILSFRK